MKNAGNNCLYRWLLGCALALSFAYSVAAQESTVTSVYDGRSLTVTATHSTVDTVAGTWTTFYTVTWETIHAGLGTAWVKTNSPVGAYLWASSSGSVTDVFSYTVPTSSSTATVCVYIDVYGQQDVKILTVDQPTESYVSWLVGNVSDVSYIGDHRALAIKRFRVMKAGDKLYETGDLKLGQTDWICIESESGGSVTLEQMIYYPYVWDETKGVYVFNRVVIEMWTLVEEKSFEPGTCPDDPPPEITDTDAVAEVVVVNPVDPDNPQPPPDVGPIKPVDAEGEETTGTVWNSEETTDALDKATFMEGIGKLEKQLQQLNGKLAAGAGGGGSDPNADAITAAAAEGAGATDGEGKGEGADSAKSEIQAAFTGGQDTPALSLSSASASMVFSGLALGTINIDPASDPVISAAGSFIKNMITWVASVVFAWFCWMEFGAVVSSLMQAQQAKGNPIIGGTGAQATALVAAAAITGILIAVPLAYWAFATYDINPPPTGSGAANIALYLLFFFIPVSYLLSLVAASFVVKKAGIVLIAGTATLIRFIVP